MSTKSERMLAYLGDILRKKYPNLKVELPLDELLDWDLWPGFLKIHGTIARIK